MRRTRLTKKSEQDVAEEGDQQAANEEPPGEDDGNAERAIDEAKPTSARDGPRQPATDERECAQC